MQKYFLPGDLSLNKKWGAQCVEKSSMGVKIQKKMWICVFLDNVDVLD